ncbi:aminobenzoyl-glutamate utilization protein A [Bacillus oleivorans]|uniref:Aminobenzoyl-glutamate utilization protein A n=1 Tax=Bacillus oleivorans TaxID=1448271 RepID=A0A285CIM5_9BACI|nr:amidohydrolase [Bacillus oleivorans]SNX67205.1 aminobenzoyl-glutamate utilization protein A [Bacillus oleivorans]
MVERLEHFIQTVSPHLLERRREFHQWPEVGWTEYVSTYKIGTILEKLGFKLTVGKEAITSKERLGVPAESEIEKNEQQARQMGVPDEWMEKMEGGNTGLVAQFDTGKPGKHVAMRFDIDALPIKEAKEAGHAPFAIGFVSKHEGSMHACGHDGHTVIGLGVAEFIVTFQEELSGRFTLLFQPAEEGGRGAITMVERGWLNDVDLFLSGHIGIHSIPVGEIAATSTNFLATTKLNVIYRGKSAHAGLEPNCGRNALLAAAAASLHLNGITRHAEGATRINIGRLEAGSGRNIIADYARMEIETRGQTTALNEYMVEEAVRIIKASADLYGVQVESEVAGTAISADCSQVLIPVIEKACESSKSITKVHQSLPLGASEDVSFMIDRVQKNGGQATFLLFGSPLPAGHHHPRFDFDENVIPVAVETFSRILLETK